VAVSARPTRIARIPGSAGGDRVSLARRQVVERRLERCPQPRRQNALAEHAASLVERHECQLRESIDLSQGLAQSLKRGIGTG